MTASESRRAASGGLLSRASHTESPTPGGRITSARRLSTRSVWFARPSTLRSLLPTRPEAPVMTIVTSPALTREILARFREESSHRHSGVAPAQGFDGQEPAIPELVD